MALFSASPPTYQVTQVPADTATQIYNTLGPSSAGITAGTVLSNLTVINNGPAVAYIGQDDGVTTAIGIPLNPGGSMVLEDTNTSGSESTWNLFAITPAGTAATIQVGLSSVVATV